METNTETHNQRMQRMIDLGKLSSNPKVSLKSLKSGLRGLNCEKGDRKIKRARGDVRQQ